MIHDSIYQVTIHLPIHLESRALSHLYSHLILLILLECFPVFIIPQLSLQHVLTYLITSSLDRYKEENKSTIDKLEILLHGPNLKFLQQ